MLYRVEARTRQGDLLNLELEDTSSGYIVADIDGLDPVKAILVSSSFANGDGEYFQSSRREPRNIKFRLELDPDPEVETVRQLRTKLYKFFMPESEVRLRFFLEDDLEVDIVGRVESCETAHFAQEPAVDISIMCFDPDFYELTPIVVPGTTTAGEVPITIEYEGSIETGFKLVMDVDRDLPEFTIYHVLPDDQIKTLEFNNAPLLAGDVLTISTIFGSKGVSMVRAGTTYPLLFGVSPQSVWLQLVPGTNAIRVYATGDDIPLTIEYTNKYGGL